MTRPPTVPGSVPWPTVTVWTNGYGLDKRQRRDPPTLIGAHTRAMFDLLHPSGQRSSPRHVGLAVPAVAQRRVQPAGLVNELLLGPLAGIGEVAVRVPHHPLGTVIVVLDGDVDRHARSLPHELSVSRCPAVVNGQWSLRTVPKRPPCASLRQRVREQPGQQPNQRHVCPPDSAVL